MKTYKTWEMIKELTENPEKKFRLIDDLIENNVVTRMGPNICWNDGSAVWLLDIDTRKWEEVKEPVDFKEAINSGKCIKPATWDTDYWDLSLLMYALSDYDDEDIREIINGEWYIED